MVTLLKFKLLDQAEDLQAKGARQGRR